MALILDLNAGDALHIGNGTVVKVEKKKGQKVRLSIQSDYKVELKHGAKTEHGTRPEKPDTSKAAIPFERPSRT